MSTADRLRQIALEHFANKGFTATALSAIADEAGIRKASIYAHFKSKDDLYLQISEQVIRDEIAYARLILLSRKGSLTGTLEQYLRGIRTRYETTANTRFWLRAFYLPPEHLIEAALPSLHDFMDDMEATMTQPFLDSKLKRTDAKTLGVAYLAIVDSLQSELLWGGTDKFERRRAALWTVFRDSLDKYLREAAPLEGATVVKPSATARTRARKA